MRNLMIGALALVLLFGCIDLGGTTEEGKTELGKELNQTVVVPDTGLISVSGSENLSVVTIRAAKTNGRWQFPLQDYPDEFLAAGLYSDTFIRLNRSHMAWLYPGEDIWLTPMVKDGKGVLFNAVYSKEVADCDADMVDVLGRGYPLSDLTDGSSFVNDDKWKVALEKEGGCVKRIVIYLDGYFSDLQDGEQISLFRNDNTVLFGFEDMANEPKVKVIATRPAWNEAAGSPAKTMSYNITIAPGLEGEPNYTATYTEGHDGIRIELDRPMPMYNNPECPVGDDYVFCGDWDRTDGQLYDIPLMNATWRLVRLEYDTQGGFMLLGKEPQEIDLVDIYLDGYGDFGNGILPNETASVTLGGREWVMSDALDFEPLRALLYRLDRPSTSLEIPWGRAVSAGGDYLYYYRPVEDYAHGTARGVFYKYSDMRELQSGRDGIMLGWENGSGMMSLKSIFIPAGTFPRPAAASLNVISLEDRIEAAPECLVLDSPGKYSLAGSDEGTPCVIIESSDVALDCQGRSIKNTVRANIGILVKGGRNVSIENCDISGFGYAIDMPGTEASIVRNNTFQPCYIGIMGYKGTDNQIEGNNDASCQRQIVQSDWSSIFG